MLSKIKLIKNSWGAQKVKILCLSSIFIVVGSLSAMAQQQQPIYSTRGGDTARMEIRLQQMEREMRGLTGRVEEQVYEINQLKQKIRILEAAPKVDASQLSVPELKVEEQNKPLNLGFKPPEISGIKTAIPGGIKSSRGDATAKYEASFADLKAQKYTEAQAGFEDFLVNHSDHVLAANAKYWLGETHYVRGDYKKSARIFAEGFQKYPDSAKSPDILLKLGMSLAGLGKEKDACVALSQVSVKFPAGNGPVLKRAEQEMIKLDCES